MTDQEHDVRNVRRFARGVAEPCGHAFHRQQVFWHWHGEAQVGKLRQVARRGFVPGRNVAFDAVVKPVGRQTLILGDSAGALTDQGSGLEKGIHVLGRQTRGKSEDHDRATEEANLTDHILPPEFVGQSAQRGEYLFARQGRGGMLWRAHATRRRLPRNGNHIQLEVVAPAPAVSHSIAASNSSNDTMAKLVA